MVDINTENLLKIAGKERLLKWISSTVSGLQDLFW